MKNTIILTFVIFFTHALFAAPDSALSRSNGLLRFLVEQEGIRNYALGTIIASRCNTYMPYSGKAPCRSAVNKMIELLDYDIILPDTAQVPNSNGSWKPNSYVFAAFKTNLISLLSSARTEAYLSDLNQKLYQYYAGNLEETNIWEITLSHYKTEYEASKVISALFQDTSRMKLHLAYLDRANIQKNNNFHSNHELLGRVIDTINQILDTSEDEFRSLFYPKEIQKDLNRNIYHFYVPHFLAKSLIRTGIKMGYATSATLLMTLSYEFITSASDYRYLFKDPEIIDDLHKIKDIFGGYCGSNVGARGLRFFKSFEVIRASFERSTADAVDLLLKMNHTPYAPIHF